MNDQIKTVLKKRYEAEIEDAKYKIKCYSEQELIIPEHPDITGEVDTLLGDYSKAKKILKWKPKKNIYNLINETIENEMKIISKSIKK